MEERLQKFMARCGVASRRKCDELIAEGMVELNGEVVREAGVKIDPVRDHVRVNGKPLHAEKSAYYVHYKVKGVTTTVSDDLGRKTVMDCLPNIRERVYPVGRLDKESEGLLLLTNDGELANYITHPAHGIEKTYRVVAEGRVPEDVLYALAEKGIRLGPVLIRPTHVKLVRYDNDNTVVLVSVSEGVNREVRRIFAALGHEVKKLLRTQVGPISLEGMKRGQTRPLTPRELKLLRNSMEGADPKAEAAQFPSGTAKSRKPAGPRGRARPVKAPRHGKPDPAKAVRSPGGGKPSAPSAGSGRRGRGSVVVDDWQKRGTPARLGKQSASPDAPVARTGRGVKTLRPSKPGAKGPVKSAAVAPKPAPARPARPPVAINHPLSSKPVASRQNTAKPGRGGKTRAPARGKPGRKGKN